MSKLNITLNKNSFVDYPGKITAILFFSGCNLDCWYCHNRHILNQDTGDMPIDEAFKFLSSRVGFLDAVTFSGGEALLNPELTKWMEKAKKLSLLVKLDTNGQLNKELLNVLSSGLVDYVAMDIKAPKGKYELATKGADEEAIFKSAEYILNQSVDYEFRTTYMPLLNLGDIEDIAKTIKGAKAYYIQQYRKPQNIKGHIFPDSVSPELIRKAADIAKKYVPNTLTRGI